MRRFILAVAVAAIAALSALTVGVTTAVAATPTNGTVFAHLTGTSAPWPGYPSGLQGAATVADAVAADDGAFIQLPANYWVEMAFPDGVYATPDGTTSPDFTIYTYDALFRADAGISVYVKSNTNNWVSRGVQRDDQGDLGINLEGVGMVNQVRVIQDGYYMDPAYPNLGFDLNAISTNHYATVATGCGTPPTMDAPWQFVEQNFVNAVGVGPVTPIVTTALNDDMPYRLFATGLYSAGPAFSAGTEILADARYSWSPGQTIPVEDRVFGYLTYGPTLLDLLITNAEGTRSDWVGAIFNDEHTYTMDLMGGGSPATLTLKISDIFAQNNLGGLCVSMFKYQYGWDGFFRPIENPEVVNIVKAGQSIPVKFSLGGDFGLDIFFADYPASKQIACSINDGTSALDETVTAGGSTLQYDPTTQTYTYVWKTDKAWAGSCRQLDVKLADGTVHSATFQFKK